MPVCADRLHLHFARHAILCVGASKMKKIGESIIYFVPCKSRTRAQVAETTTTVPGLAAPAVQ